MNISCFLQFCGLHWDMIQQSALTAQRVREGDQYDPCVSGEDQAWDAFTQAVNAWVEDAHTLLACAPLEPMTRPMAPTGTWTLTTVPILLDLLLRRFREGVPA